MIAGHNASVLVRKYFSYIMVVRGMRFSQQNFHDSTSKWASSCDLRALIRHNYGLIISPEYTKTELKV
jgi:hypothetical protein